MMTVFPVKVKISFNKFRSALIIYSAPAIANHLA